MMYNLQEKIQRLIRTGLIYAVHIQTGTLEVYTLAEFNLILQNRKRCREIQPFLEAEAAEAYSQQILRGAPS